MSKSVKATKSKAKNKLKITISPKKQIGKHKKELLKLVVQHPYDGNYDTDFILSNTKAAKDKDENFIECLLCLSASNNYECQRCSSKY